ncbi:MAG: hypothetical protein ACYTHM_02990, partial [Planctomycetota bacterium]
MRSRFLLILLLGALGAAGCNHPQTLRFEEEMAVMPALRAEADLRYHKGSGWNMPAAPGTKEAEDRENWRGILGGGILFRFHGDISYREVKDSDEVRPAETAAVNNTTFGPGTVDGVFRVNRENVGVQFGFFTDRHHFG